MPPKNILIVEELPSIYQMLRPALEMMGAELRVVDVPSGEEASLESMDSKVDLLVTEYQLNGMTGLELMRNIRRMHPLARTILILEQPDPATEAKIAKAGAGTVFVKPFSDESFIAKVKELLGVTESSVAKKEKKAEPEGEAEQEETASRVVQLDESGTPPRLPELLADLRQAMGAMAVYVLQDGCDVLARAGDLQEGIPESEYLPAVCSMHLAGVRAAHALEWQAYTDWHVLPGEDHDLVLFPAGSRHIILAAGSGIANNQHIVQTLDALTSARERLLQCLEESSEEEEPRVTRQPVVEKKDQAVAGQEPLLGKPGKVPKTKDVDQFWEQDLQEGKPPARPDTLSFEQARQLGLVPGEES